MGKLRILVGRNLSGKTTELKSLVNNDCIFFPTEIDIEKYYQTELAGKKKNPSPLDFTPQGKLIKFINDIFINAIHHKNYSVEIDNTDFTSANNLYEVLNNKLNDTHGDYYNTKFKDAFVLNPIYASVNTNKTFTSSVPDFISFEKVEDLKFSSGANNFSMLLLLSYLIKELNVTQQINKEIIIDEPEKFLHEELQAKIASVLFDLSENVNITISTHSPYMLCWILWLEKIKTSQRVEIIYCSYNSATQTTTKQNVNTIDISRLSFEETINIVKSFFATNLLLVEGKTEETLLYDIMPIHFPNRSWTIIGCNGKGNVKKFFELIKTFNLPNLKLIPIYDLDKQPSLNLDNEIVFTNCIEDRFLELDSTYIDDKGTTRNKWKIKNNGITNVIRKAKDLSNVVNKSTLPTVQQELDKLTDQIKLLLI